MTSLSKKILKGKGETLIDQLKDSLNEYNDIFRLKSYSNFLFEPIKRMKEDLSIAESVAMYQQLERKGKPLDKCLFWYLDYKKYLQNKTPNMRKKLVKTAPSGFFRPDLESICKILELVDIEMDIFEDLYFDIIDFLKQYKIYKDLKVKV